MPLNTYCQLKAPVFKIYSEEEIKMKNCSFDPEADAVVLFDIVKADHNEEYNLIQQKHTRIKILKDKGIERANISIPYYKENGFEFLKDIKATVFTLNENGTSEYKDLQKSDIFDQKINDKISVIKFALPNVKVGSIIEYTYTSHSKNYSGLRDWYFQTEIPTIRSSFSVVIIPGAEFSYAVFKKSNFHLDVQQDKTTGSITYTMQNIPGLRDEPFIEATKDYLQRVEFQLASYSRYGDKIKYINSWSDISKQLLGEPDFGRLIEKKLSATDDLINAAKSRETHLDKIKFIHAYFRKNFTWNGYNSKYATNGLKATWEKKTGNSGELNLLMLNILSQVGVEVYPLLVSNREHGKVNKEVPMLDQFNKVVSCVWADGNKYILDASDQYTPYHLIPYSILNTYGFLIHKNKSEIVDLKFINGMHLNNISVTAQIEKDGLIKGDATIQSSNYARLERLKDVKINKDKFISDYYTKGKEIKIDSLKLLNTEDDSQPLHQEFKFLSTATSTGNFYLLDLNIFSGYDKNPFTAASRFSRINFGCIYNTNIQQKYILPENFKPETLPKNIHIKTADKSLELIRIIKFEGNELNVEVAIKINEPVFTVEMYDQLKDFYKKMSTTLNEQVVLKIL